MFKSLLKNKKAQNTAEYALLIALVVAGVIAMQTYAQRALQARVRDAAQFMAQHSGDNQVGFQMGNTLQYEPYYLNSSYAVSRDSDEKVSSLLGGETTKDSTSNRSRDIGGYTSSSYTASGNGI